MPPFPVVPEERLVEGGEGEDLTDGKSAQSSATDGPRGKIRLIESSEALPHVLERAPRPIQRQQRKLRNPKLAGTAMTTHSVVMQD